MGALLTMRTIFGTSNLRATSTVTDTSPPIYITSNITTTTINTSVSTLLTFYTQSENSNTNQLLDSNSLPGYEILFVVITMGIVIMARKRSS